LGTNLLAREPSKGWEREGDELFNFREFAKTNSFFIGETLICMVEFKVKDSLAKKLF
jgi:hypothetical protein